MELRNFVSEALKDIMGGVEDAQRQAGKGHIVPETIDSFDAVNAGISNLQTVSFEVTVATDESAGSNAKLNVVAAFVGGGVSGESKSSNAHAAKLAFKVPVMFPVSDEKS